MNKKKIEILMLKTIISFIKKYSTLNIKIDNFNLKMYNHLLINKYKIPIDNNSLVEISWITDLIFNDRNKGYIINITNKNIQTKFYSKKYSIFDRRKYMIYYIYYITRKLYYKKNIL